MTNVENGNVKCFHVENDDEAADAYWEGITREYGRVQKNVCPSMN